MEYEAGNAERKAELGAALFAAALRGGDAIAFEGRGGPTESNQAFLARRVGCNQQPAPEVVPGLTAWLGQVGLASSAGRAAAWCERMGACSLEEVFEARGQLAQDLALGPAARRRIELHVSNLHAEPQPTKSVTIPGPRPSCSTYGPPEDPDKYNILEKLGWGATATVFRCGHKGHEYALKVTDLTRLKKQPNYTEICELLYQEIAILLSLKHPRVVSLVDVVEEPRSLGIVMELVEGGDLQGYIARKGALAEAEASHVFAQLADGLSYIHLKGIIHQDLKPDNILVDEKASRPEMVEVKLADFGHSKVVDDVFSPSTSRMGTPLYRAPEASDSTRIGGYDSSVDLWSLGVVLFVMLVGSCPFSGSGAQLEQEIQSGSFSFWSDDDRPPPSKEAQSLVGALLKVDPRKRLSLDWCLAHPFVATSAGFARQLLKLGLAPEPQPLEERYRLPGLPTGESAYALRRDLWRWTLKFRFSAMMRKLEVVASYGDAASADWENVGIAHHELREVMGFHIGAKRPAKGNVEEAVAERQREMTNPGGSNEPQPQQAVEPTDGGTAERPSEPENEAVARQRRLESRRQKAAAGQGPQWNFSGRGKAAAVNDRFREHEAELDRRRRLAYRHRGDPEDCQSLR